MMKRSELVEIDLSKMKLLFYNIDTNINYELELIKNYSYYTDRNSDTIRTLYNIILSDLYRDTNTTYKDLEISKFFKMNRLNDKVERFIEVLEFRILNKVNPRFEQIKFKKIDNDLICLFEVWYEDN